ncbi:MAG: response regulator transcription factor [Dysgonomonas sp.]
METKNNKPRILVVDDEPDIRDILEFNLENEGFSIDTADSAEQALTKLLPDHQLIILDVMMGGMSGYRMAEKLRKSGNNIPVIFLTAKDTENDLLTGFSTGGDDYITKPFSVKEVIARVKSIIKRTADGSKEPDNGNLLKTDTLLVDLDAKRVSVDGVNIELTKTEFKILTLLMQNEHKLFSREDILNKVWTDGGIVVNRTVDVHIARLRKKIGKYGSFIINRTGYGYSFIPSDN